MGHLEPAISEAGGQVLAIAVSATFAQQAFAASLGIGFPLLSDWDRQVCESYGVRYDSWKGHAGIAKRSLFLVDQGGTVRYRWVTDDAYVEPDLDEAMTVLRSLQR